MVKENMNAMIKMQWPNSKAHHAKLATLGDIIESVDEGHSFFIDQDSQRKLKKEGSFQICVGN